MSENRLKIYNSLNSKKEIFEPLSPPFVGLYVCGPTVYNEVHLGNVRTFITFDIVYRYLKFLGYKVRYVRNITDVGHLVDDADAGEDKIEKRARLEKIEPMEIVQKYTNSFHDVTKLFNLISPSIEPTATGHIIEQIEMIQDIIKNGYAYEINGSVYFDVKKYAEKYNYGELSGRKLDELIENTREELEGGTDKKFFADFALWKKASENTIMKWPSPWGIGVPGWHLECSVMSTKYLGKSFDIHGGGMDLKFPHHECEIAQSVGSGNEHPVKYWMHGNMLTVNGTKMSKSLGNSFLPLELIAGSHPLLEKGYSPMVVKFFFLQANYRSTVDFSNEALQAAEKGYARMMTAIETLDEIMPSATTSFDIVAFINKTNESMNDDFNTPVTIANLFDGVKIINNIKSEKATITAKDLTKLKALYNNFIFDIFGLQKESSTAKNDYLDGIMNIVMNIRHEAKASKNWELSDLIRDELKKLNITIQDSKDGSNWTVEN
ncbi:MAG: cysteine--tRNA ligase [Vicingaceae bacterium]|jgi:cysteinyl-tRNA synthetase|nr:cysteine--tRNA ligase [Flavobacteriales bacterium]MBQ20286.1 cysteine--tRNA ligase [Flavobacteriales bacterium]MDF1674475.1 cysteine--tRNA ligase [Vicingaceae bacterium]|tara:strand:+ start:207134 stop:208609 length:1476 start_codon:yes stop_codon:yes gene_type:complete